MNSTYKRLGPISWIPWISRIFHAVGRESDLVPWDHGQGGGACWPPRWWFLRPRRSAEGAAAGSRGAERSCDCRMVHLN